MRKTMNPFRSRLADTEMSSVDGYVRLVPARPLVENLNPLIEKLVDGNAPSWHCLFKRELGDFVVCLRVM
jgi:hypothetical protein